MDYTIANLITSMLFGLICVAIILPILLSLIDRIVFGCDCPYDPEDNPFPQGCDRRVINTDICEECPWRKGVKGD